MTGSLRKLTLASAALWLLPVAQAQTPVPALPTERVYEFDVNLDKRPIGTHRFTVRQRDDGTASIQSTASFDVRLLGITAYRYRHQATERWTDGCLAAIEATTDDNGRRLQVNGLQREDRFQLEQPASTPLPACLAAYAYWNRDLLLRQRALLNPQTGRLDSLRVEPLGRETLQVKGEAMQADRYRLHAAQNTIDLWYSLRGDWLRLESLTGSRRLIYRLRETPEARIPR
jgi:Family of unknown function (DUF6134)